MTLLVSNYAFLEVLDPIPKENIGWEVHAVSPADFETIVAVFPSWDDMTFSRPLNDCGVGSIAVASDDPRLQTDVGGWPLEDTEVLFRVYDEGVLRFDWLAEKPSRPEDKPGLLQISGRGTAALFERGIVLPAGYPTGQATTRTVTGTRMGVWLMLLEEAQLRGTIPEVTIDFDAVADSAGVAWPVAETFDVNVGDNLLDLLSQFTELIGATWVMRPGMILTVFMTYGNDRRDEVVWHLGGHTQEHAYERDRTSIGTVIYSGKDGDVQAASDLAAEDRWGRRERWISSGDTVDSAAIARYATRNLEIMKDQKKVRTVTVPWKAPFRRVFVDWAPGDIVSVETLRDGVQAIKVIAASIKVDRDTQTTVELTISDDPTAALPREVSVAQQSARDGSRATQSRASKAPKAVATTTVVAAGTGLSGGGAIGGGTSIAVDVEWLQDTVGAMLLSGTGVTLSYDDALGKLGAAVDLEWLQDTIAAMLVGAGVQVTYDDGAGTITLSPSARAVLTKTTASLATMASETGTLAMAPSYRVLSVTVDRACRVRLYTTTSARTADASRAPGTDPTGDHGVMLDLVFTGAGTLTLSPTVDGFLPSGTVVPYSIQNRDATTGTVQVDMTWVRTE